MNTHVRGSYPEPMKNYLALVDRRWLQAKVANMSTPCNILFGLIPSPDGFFLPITLILMSIRLRQIGSICILQKMWVILEPMRKQTQPLVQRQ